MKIIYEDRVTEFTKDEAFQKRGVEGYKALTAKKAKPAETFRARLVQRQKCVEDRVNACRVEYRSLYKDMVQRKKEIEIYEAVVMEIEQTIQDFDEVVKGVER